MASEGGGVKLERRYRLLPGSYEIQVENRVTNVSEKPLAPTLYMQLTRDGNAAPGASGMYSTYTGPVVYTDAEKFQKVDFGDIEKGKAKHATKADNGWVGVIQHYFATAWVPEQGVPREYYTRRIENNLYSVGRARAAGADRPGPDASTNAATLFVGTAGPADPGAGRARPGTGRGLRLADGDRQAALLAARRASQDRRQLGLGDRAADDPGQARVLPAAGRQLPLDGQDEEGHAQADGAARALRQRPGQDEPGDDGVVQDREDQPARRLPADRGADPGVHRALLGAARVGRDPQCALDRLDPGPVDAGSLVHPAGDHGRDHVHPDAS